MVDIPLLIRDLVLFLLIALVVNFITEKLSVPYTLGLVIVGLSIGLVGLAPEAQLSPDLVLALPLDVPSREVPVVSTHAVVLFTLLIQGLSIRWVLQRVLSPSPTRQAPLTGNLPGDEPLIDTSTPEEEEPSR